ncbi:MAG: hypothetical protein GY790_01460 [Bacteroidetes bacterium]|nr:hypothetical protein [Bacteroidota bacterium]
MNISGIRRFMILLILVCLVTTLRAQSIREFQNDTATFITELRAFTGSALQTSEIPDFERFISFFDSVPYEQQMEIIEVSNLMRRKSCRPRPQFINYQRVMMEFFTEDKTSHGYDEWLEGYKLFLHGENALLRIINQWLKLSLTLLEDNVFYSSNTLIWKVSSPSFRFQTDETLKVMFDDVTVACISGMDSIQIVEATGYIDPLTLEWVGSRGKVTWERVDIPDTDLYAQMGDFKINLKTSTYHADSVTLYYPVLFDQEVIGRLDDKLTVLQNIQRMKYPQFTSYKNFYKIDEFVPGIDYQGGLSIEGANLVGSGVQGEPAELKIYSNDTLRIKAKSNRFSLNDRFIRSSSTEVFIYFGKDSIFHPNLVQDYDVAKEQLRLGKSDGFTSQGPYSNTYHGIDMNFDELVWIRGESLMKFQAMLGSSSGRATFESNTFFNFDFFMGLQGMDYDHPLAQLAAYSKMLQGRNFNSGPYADFIGYAEYQVKHQLMALAKLGFVYFDDQTQMITLRQKLFDYMESAMRKRDYDVIRFNSRVEGVSNADFDLQTRDLTIRGIPIIFLSDSQNVKLIPENNTIVMKRNRSFQFDGVVDAGLFRFTGHNFFFQYDTFKISMQKIDSLQMSINTGETNQYGEAVLVGIDNAIENMTGELLIDEPNNKSGLERYPQYPTFSSHEKSYIYFDSPNIQNGVYERNSFYFELEAFTFDSLDNFRPEAIAPNGTFTSAGILPPLEMQMTLREDNSLGFYMQTPEEGLDIYDGLGIFHNDVEMSSSGLHGYGSFDYLTSTSWSDKFLMHPDSMMARTRRFLIRERREATKFPHVENAEADITLLAGDQVMRVNRVEETFRMFEDSVFHRGDMELRPIGLTGSGAMGLVNARLESDRFRYEARAIFADSAGVQLRADWNQDFTFLTDDVNLVVDLDARKGEFSANGDQTLIEFPYNLYETNLDKITWFMDEGKVGLSQSKLLPENTVDIGIDSLKTNGPVYRSVHPGQDDLNFVAPGATYDYYTRHLYAHKVPFIEVADAYVFPDSGEVEIGYQASMDLLKNARVLANQYNRNHNIYNASIAVIGAKDYTGSGYYDYMDAFGNSHDIFFEKIWVDSTLVTRSLGKVEQNDPFMLSPFFDFKGDVQLEAQKHLLTFDGGTRIVHDCAISKGWLRFTSEVDPADIRIPVGEQMMNTDLNKLFAGSLITRDSTHIYSAFLSSRKDYFDANITNATGTLIYDQERENYVIGSEAKLADSTLPGSLLRLETNNCRLYGEGPIDLTLNYGQVKIKSAGNASHYVESDLFEANLILGLDFMFSPDALNVMGQEIDSLPDLEPVDLTRHNYVLGMRDLLGETQARSLERQLALTGAYTEIPPSWKHTIFFNELPLQWNQQTRSFRHNGKVGIGNIGDIQINKKVDAYVELVEKGSGDIFDIYLMVDDNTWYYIAYSPGGMQVLSSNRTFNNIVFELKVADRRIKSAPGRPGFVYSLAAQRRLSLFIDRFLEFEDE